VAFEVRVAKVEELTEGPPHELAIENAYRKAAAVSELSRLASTPATPDATVPREVVLGADTIVALGSRIYGKPADEAEARATLSALAGRAHAVITGICVLEAGRRQTAAATTLVRFRAIPDELLEWYVASGEWRERAGGYAVQGRGAALVESIDGDYTNVVGLPVPTLLELCPALLA
jgi:septum formation protein